MNFANIKKVLGSGGIIACGRLDGVDCLFLWRGGHGINIYVPSDDGYEDVDIWNIGDFKDDDASEKEVIKAIRNRTDEAGERYPIIYKVKKV